ncbi:6-carboxytetrahydropterin synthase [Streptomyces sp. B1866]|uniref:6-pyruvoyl trahydropterin synthase family protein n=1 Tax=Streptomyces sp. B1866 TaxID=3075431 RepID=UPI002891BE04|nr:6-carboxytetrahydropterin synthase [Streptomyces sp. B1866]MDT3398293.1 6-carboxytetrahydropterin synthase [Streptomyces sp. B1866]
MTTVQPDARPLLRAKVGGVGWDFNAAHTGLHDGVFEPLHGHTYQVELAAWGPADETGLVADFRVLKQHLREVITPLKRRTLIATRTAGVSVEDADQGQIQVNGGGACFTLPKAWVVLLPTSGTSTEALACYLVAQLARRISTACPGVERLELTLTESAECAATAEAVLG